MAELRCTANVLDCARIQERMESLQLKQLNTDEHWGIFVDPVSTDAQIENGSFFVCESDNPPLGMVEIWNTADGELI